MYKLMQLHIRNRIFCFNSNNDLEAIYTERLFQLEELKRYTLIQHFKL